jgi:Ca2+-binding RTX toxin-like protein
MEAARRTRHGILALAVVASALTGITSAATAAPASCRGLAATVVGTPGEPLDGTDGPDVIVSNGATYIDAKAGDDVVCATGRSPLSYEDPTIDAGDGADVVDTTGSTAVRVHSFLGPGDDVFIGGDRPDDVDAANGWDTPRSNGADSVSTGGGADFVVTGGGAQADADTIDLGSGNDETSVQGTVDPEQTILGGPGSDQIEFERRSLVRALTIDNATGTATASGRPALTWESFERFRVSPTGPSKPPAFVGGPQDEVVWTAIPLTSVDLGAGDDVVNLEVRPSRLVDTAFYTGGPGDDSLIVHAGAGDQTASARLDLRSGRLVFPVGDRVVRNRLAAFESVRLSADRLRMRGTPRADRLEWSGCHGYVDGGAGDDVIRAVDIDDVGCGAYSLDRELVVRGGAGDDALIGALGRNTLLGGPGRDTANGGRGPDRCAAEVERSC